MNSVKGLVLHQLARKMCCYECTYLGGQVVTLLVSERGPEHTVDSSKEGLPF